MIVITQRFSFKADTTPARREAVLAAMRRTSAVESTSFAFVGPELGLPADGLTHGYCVAIPDLAALERYMHDPVHLAGDPEILPYLARLTHTRFADDADPDLDDEIVALHRKKLAMYPEWEDLLNAIPSGAPEPHRT
ncbi:stress responsive alpha/beta barrel protein [Actinocorallia herbida]|uniref:Stress responsive alpha/beta barrel protein n=1 Tax=Actinocorallia herbida TaxID=58109 RepID=A0A3N1CYZ5_9ACTN|nr:Dabb family protein [Actinocorallia herbida]ROO86018.1 stress responsive alpha/beta barrel protein [Actinocorallia herbida]